MANITLYQFEQCPFCQKVRDKLAELEVEYERVNVPRDREDPQRKELHEKTGVFTVPVIRIDEEYLGDSGAIIEKLEGLYRGSDETKEAA